MTYKEKFNNCEAWQDRATILNLYHVLMTVKEGHWKMVNTAVYFGKSTGYTSESINIAEHIELVRHCKTRKEALELLNGRKTGAGHDGSDG